MRKVIDRLVSLLWTTVAGAAITLAILITVIRLLLPQLDEQRQSIELWIGDIIERPVSIGEVQASWKGWNPSIHIADLVVLNEDRTTELVRFQKAIIEISPLASVSQRNLVPRQFVVAGMKVALLRDEHGKVSIAGMPPSRWPVAEWLLQQRNFTLRDAQISYVDISNGAPPLEISDVTLKILHNNDGHLVLHGLGRRAAEPDTRYRIQFSVDGDILSDDWSGELRLDLRNVDATRALKFAGVDESVIGAGTLNARIWSQWDNAKLQLATVGFGALGLKPANGNTSFAEDITGTFKLLRHHDGWSAEFDNIELNNGTSTSDLGFGSVRWSELDGARRDIAFRINALRIEDLLALTSEYGPLVEKLNNEISIWRPQGSLTNFDGALTLDEHAVHYFVAAKVKDLTTNETDTLPGLSGLDFGVRANENGGVFTAAEKNGVVVASNKWLAAPLDIKKFDGRIRWETDGDYVRVATDQIDVLAETIDLSLRGTTAIKNGRPRETNVVSRASGSDLSRLHLLIPAGVLPVRGEQWVRNVFHRGVLNDFAMILRGDVSAFPFDDNDGVFKVAMDIADVDVHYSSKWPVANRVTAGISIDRRHVKTAVEDGEIYEAPVGGSTIEMPDLFTRERLVRVRGRTEVKPEKLGEFISDSPLANTKAARYGDIDIDNPFEMTLDMNLGMFPGGEKEILGLVHFAGNRIHSTAQRITLEDVHGDISFTRQDWYGEGLKAIFDGDRVGVILNGGLDDPNYDTEFRMTGTSDASQLLKYLERYAPVAYLWLKHNDPEKSVTGRLPWKAVMTIPEAGNGNNEAPKRLAIESSLVGLNVDLPWPFSKTSAEKKPLAIRVATSTNGDRVTHVDYGDTVDMEINQVRHVDGKIETVSAEILFGEAAPEFNQMPGLSARGNIDRLPLSEWADFARKASKAMTNTTKELPISFDVAINKLETLGRIFDNTQLSGARKKENWLVTIDSDQAVGTISVPRGEDDRPLSMDFERLWLTKLERDENRRPIDPRALPSIDLHCQSLRYGNIDLGQARFASSKVENGLELRELTFDQTNFQLQGHGQWLLESDVHQSRVSLTMQGETLSGLLKSFDYEVANIDGGATEIEIEALWGGMPFDFTLDKLHGSFELHVEEGRFLDIDPGSGRLFGLLSLQTLPRRLSLDFNDLFKKGFTFDNIEGSFELDRGNAYTNSLLMNGPAARIDISGRTGLADQDYDQRVTVTPALSNTIPVASALFGPAGMGVGAVIYLGQKMFKSIPAQVDKFLSREYSITGPWQQPVIERI